MKQTVVTSEDILKSAMLAIVMKTSHGDDSGLCEWFSREGLGGVCWVNRDGKQGFEALYVTLVTWQLSAHRAGALALLSGHHAGHAGFKCQS